jgi:hypothetical protein
MADKQPQQPAPATESAKETSADGTPELAPIEEAYKRALRVVAVEGVPGARKSTRTWRRQFRKSQRRPVD